MEQVEVHAGRRRGERAAVTQALNAGTRKVVVAEELREDLGRNVIAFGAVISVHPLGDEVRELAQEQQSLCALARGARRTKSR